MAPDVDGLGHALLHPPDREPLCAQRLGRDRDRQPGGVVGEREQARDWRRARSQPLDGDHRESLGRGGAQPLAQRLGLAVVVEPHVAQLPSEATPSPSAGAKLSCGFG